MLFASLFIDWYEFVGSGFREGVEDVTGFDFGDSFNLTGWKAFEFTDLVCAVAAALAFVRAAIVLFGNDDDPEVPGSVFTAGFGIAASAMIAYRMANPPGVGYDLKVGVFIGLLAALAIAYGSFVAMRAGRLSGDRGRV